MLNKRKLTLIASLLLIMLGVFGSLALVKRSQDLRRSAALVKTTIRLSTTTISGAVDDTVTVGIFIDTPRKVSTAKVKLCYGDALTTDVASVTNVGPLTVENSKSISNNCLTISKRVEASATIDQLPTGSFQFANVTFKIKKNGNLTISQTESLIAGDPINNDVNIPIDEVVGAKVVIGSGGGTGGDGIVVNGSSMIFESNDLTSKKVNENLSVKLYLNTSKSFDAAEVKFCYGDKLLLTDSGIVKGQDFTDIAKKTINNNCLEYAVLATSKSLTGKVLLGTFTFKAVSVGNGTLAFSSQYFSNAVDGLMKAGSAPSVNYTINSTTSTVCSAGEKRCSQYNAEVCKSDGSGWTIIDCAGLGCNAATKECNKMNYVCTPGDKQCSGNILQRCNSAGTGWETDTNCGTLGCNNTTGECNTAAPTVVPTNALTPTLSVGEATVNIKLAFAGVKSGNGQCAKDNWLAKIKFVNSADNTTVGGILTGYPTQTTAVNSRGEIVYDFSVTVTSIPDTGIAKSAFFLTGPKHIFVKYGENNQSRWYPELAGGLVLNKGINNYDLSNFPLLAGDVTGEIAGTPDGKIDGRDYSYLKAKAANLVSAVADGTNLEGDLNGDCQVNAGDIRLMIDSLKEINGQTY